MMNKGKNMQIIDKNKDYYDYCQFEFGPVDKTAIFDRRGSKVLSKQEFLRQFCGNKYSKFLSYNFSPKEKEGTWYYFDDEERPYPYYSFDSSDISPLLLEAGSVQYVLELKNASYMWIRQADGGYEYTFRGDLSLVHSFDENVHLCHNPITLIHFRNKNEDNWKSRDDTLKSALDIDVGEDTVKDALVNPILKDTPIPSIIPARDFYNALDNYFRSMYNDKTIEIKNSDIEKAINHGFDKKASFRHPVK